MALFYSQKQRLVINKSSYMSAHVLLDLLNKLENNVRLSGILPPFWNVFSVFFIQKLKLIFNEW